MPAGRMGGHRGAKRGEKKMVVSLPTLTYFFRESVTYHLQSYIIAYIHLKISSDKLSADGIK